MKTKHYHYAMTLIFLLGVVTIVVALIVSSVLRNKKENQVGRNDVAVMQVR